MKTKRNKGFTLVELLVVIAIIGILAAIVMVSLNSAKDKAKAASFKATSSSAQAAAIQCDDAGGVLVDTPSTPGATDPMCNPADPDTYWPVVASNTCAAGTGIAYDATDTLAGDGQFSYTVFCDIRTTRHTTVCTETNCQTTTGAIPVP